MRISRVSVLMRKELIAYFTTPHAYVFLVIFLVMSGFLTFMVSDFFKAGQAVLDLFFQWFPWLFLVLVPALAMSLWADERRLGTFELLATMPLTAAECITGKFIASWIFLGIALALTSPMLLTVIYLGNPDMGAVVCAYFGVFLLGGTFLAVSGIASAASKSQTVSFVFSLFICLFLIVAGWPPVTDIFAPWAPAWLMDGLASMGVMPHFEAFEKGMLDSRDIVYYLSVMFFSLYVTSVFLRQRRAA